MTITLNGQIQTVSGCATILDLLASLGFGGRPVVVELNRQALLPREHASATVNEGDVIEVVQITAGG
jgi:sulfur carrier protein